MDVFQTKPMQAKNETLYIIISRYILVKLQKIMLASRSVLHPSTNSLFHLCFPRIICSQHHIDLMEPKTGGEYGQRKYSRFFQKEVRFYSQLSWISFLFRQSTVINYARQAPSCKARPSEVEMEILT
ncbi:prolipoprotein diacylglyceryl transferase [Striga asiatica]|uniref:Prolipoprotein diacylglyceryl transferase n=1 Tax=Striga asiatica TaxID=4170 RepID=A0A5A7PNL9_STRAF|nr:prolipoprotein diacylglyceryl transferase [Striga asiatica]